ncbi:hypothetical protein FI667_g1918, partial [Globisporangium splendens]
MTRDGAATSTHAAAAGATDAASSSSASSMHEGAAAGVDVVELAEAMSSSAAATTSALPLATSGTTPTTPIPPQLLLQDAYLQQQQQQQQLQLLHSTTRRFSVGGKGKTGRQSSKFGTVNYSIDEMRRLNEKVRAVMPIAGEDWLHVAYQFNYMRPESIPYREVESLKRKFKKMYCSRSSSVSGKLPEYVEEAKELRRMINQRSEKSQLETSDTHSDLDAHDLASGLDQQSGKTTDVAAGRSGNSDSGSANGHQQSSVQEGESTDIAAGVAAMDADSALIRATKNAIESSVDRQEAARGQLQPEVSAHQHAAVQSAEPFGAGELEDDPREVARKLSQMEVEYQQALAARRASRDAGDGLAGAAAATSIGTSTPSSHQQQQQQQQQQPSASQHQYSDPAYSPTEIISMLKHSIERKRRTMEEQMLSESERVRKERKKRKMEQVLYSIHQEQRERELSGSGGVGFESTAAAILGVPHSPTVAAQMNVSSAALSAGGSAIPAPPSYSLVSASVAASQQPTSASESSLGMMEIMLRYMVAQQTETARREQLEQERREREQLEKEARRRERERQRQQEKRDFMLVMAAILEEKFPDSLKRYLEDENASDGAEHHAVEAAGAHVQTQSEPDAETAAGGDDRSNDNRNSETDHHEAALI